MDRGAGGATVHGVAKSRTQLKQLSTMHAYLIGLQRDLNAMLFMKTDTVHTTQAFVD